MSLAIVTGHCCRDYGCTCTSTSMPSRRKSPQEPDDPVPGGLSLDQALAIIGSLHSIKAVTLATYTPSRDCHGRRRVLGLSILDAIAKQLAL